MSSTVTPTFNDVIFEKGRRVQNHMGNIHYRALIEREAYNYQLAGTTTKNRKEMIERKEMVSRKILEQIPGRCLAREDYDTVYHVLSEAEAMLRIKQAMRDLKRTRRHRTNQRRLHEQPAVTKNHVEEKKVTSSEEPISLHTTHFLNVDTDMKKLIETCMTLSP